MPTIAEAIINGKMNRSLAELEMQHAITGQIFESLPLGLGSTSLRREVFPDGNKGEVVVSTQEGSTMVVNKDYVLKGGELLVRPDYNDDEASQKPSRIRKAVLLARVVFGRPDHWDKESDFYGTVEEV